MLTGFDFWEFGCGWGGRGVKIVPVLVGSVGFEKEVEYGSILAPCAFSLAPPPPLASLAFNANRSDTSGLGVDFAEPSTLVAISTDFCHWGSRFGYTYYLPLSGSPRHLSASKKEDGGKAVWRSIRELDREGMDIWGGLGEKKGAGEVHRAFEEYLESGSLLLTFFSLLFTPLADTDLSVCLGACVNRKRDGKHHLRSPFPRSPSGSFDSLADHVRRR